LHNKSNVEGGKHSFASEYEPNNSLFTLEYRHINYPDYYSFPILSTCWFISDGPDNILDEASTVESQFCSMVDGVHSTIQYHQHRGLALRNKSYHILPRFLHFPLTGYQWKTSVQCITYLKKILQPFTSHSRFKVLLCPAPDSLISFGFLSSQTKYELPLVANCSRS